MTDNYTENYVLIKLKDGSYSTKKIFEHYIWYKQDIVKVLVLLDTYKKLIMRKEKIMIEDSKLLKYSLILEKVLT